MRHPTILNTHGFRASADQVKPYFGIDQGKPWPAAGLAPRNVAGYTMYVKVLIPKEDRKGLGDYPRSYANPNRLRAICPCCDKDMSYGRLDQHMVVHGSPNAVLPLLS